MRYYFKEMKNDTIRQITHCIKELKRIEKRPQTAHCAICGAMTNLFDKVEEQFVCSIECDDILCDWAAKEREPND